MRIAIVGAGGIGGGYGAALATSGVDVTFIARGAHLAAIRAAHEGAFFSESMFARFVPLHLSGRWRGQSYG